MTPTLHVLGLPHTQMTDAWSFCAYTARTRTFAEMMTRAGYNVILYSPEGSTANVTENVPIITTAERLSFWPDYSPANQVFNSFDPHHIGWYTFNRRCINEMSGRCSPGDIVCVTMGTTQQLVTNAFPELFPVETGIGYSGVFAPFRVFESWAWRHYLSGRYGPDDVRFFDAVIPRAYDINDFPLGSGNGGYALFMGRLTRRKGPHIAALAAATLGVPLLVAGQGVADVSPGKITCDDGTELIGDVTYVGVLNPAERAAIMGDAIATFVPTMYLEPFGGVSVESQLCGTPAICSDWGGLRENVSPGITGYLCNTLAEFVFALENSDTLDRGNIRHNAQETWGTDEVRWSFIHYFDRLGSLNDQGWYQLSAVERTLTP